MTKKMLAMVLAGGGGERLKPLTKKLAKPAVLFGGKYRIIDFALSNCINSNIYTIGIVVQYEPLVLNSHINSGGIWDMHNGRGQITILPPYMNEKGGCWYKGTANAIYQNLEYIDMHNPEYVIILSADQVYKMDYSKMLDEHIKKSADVTVAVTSVEWKEASRFGIMEVNDNGKIIKFEEKPKEPNSNLASMGIYIFNTDFLKKCLIEDEKDDNSSNDFGKNIIPKLMNSDANVNSYKFDGYWMDVGTVNSFWKAHMDLLEEDNKLNLYDPSWKIYCEHITVPPLYINHTAKVNSSMLGEGCYILGEVNNSVIFPGVFVGRGAVIRDSVIMSNVRIEDNVTINRTIAGSNSWIKSPIISNENSSDSKIYYIDEGQIIE
ncbi:glucose-1-phosphate adenylyltransferase [Ruminiclostridium herbifermentans]|uniref:Glucose-1-phosphate adenylyltransferase n=1 Tax=Ruminiclostridium herbifermentans TaxID=2488810 RepID=A0A4U7JN60_9FIRM|nr:glucose-1-phosphate adenylyltransferase [Ruminiclostridium herbifermentans]QNU68496.1 glucose-1-phosphate adenylyltransferase [Ruminiclostridium herbifermentans]